MKQTYKVIRISFIEADTKDEAIKLTDNKQAEFIFANNKFKVDRWQMTKDEAIDKAHKEYVNKGYAKPHVYEV